MQAVIGTGTWGAAVAWLMAREGQEVLLWGRDPAKVERIASERRHPRLDIELPPGLRPVHDPAALQEASHIWWAVPTQHSRAILQQLAPVLHGKPLISLSKGLEQETLQRVSEIVASVLGPGDYACLSGPSHAEEVVRGLPVALVTAGADRACQMAVEQLHHGRIRIYTSTDLIGVELGGALKNVIAVAAGICDGLGLGDNAKAALVTRGLAEMRRLGRALGAEDATFAGLAGIGDLLATCYSPHGRNLALGLAIATGERLDEHLARTGMVAEGAWTCLAAVALAARHGCELPIASQVASMLWDARPVADAIEALLTRASKDEDA